MTQLSDRQLLKIKSIFTHLTRVGFDVGANIDVFKHWSVFKGSHDIMPHLKTRITDRWTDPNNQRLWLTGKAVYPVCENATRKPTPTRVSDAHLSAVRGTGDDGQAVGCHDTKRARKGADAGVGISEFRA
jgi:hypothetical protein